MRTLEAALLMIALPCATACPLCAVLAVLSRDSLLGLWGFGTGAVSNALTTVVLVLEGKPAVAAISAGLAVGCALGWWDMWRRGRPAPGGAR